MFYWALTGGINPRGVCSRGICTLVCFRDTCTCFGVYILLSSPSQEMSDSEVVVFSSSIPELPGSEPLDCNKQTMVRLHILFCETVRWGFTNENILINYLKLLVINEAGDAACLTKITDFSPSQHRCHSAAITWNQVMTPIKMKQVRCLFVYSPFSVLCCCLSF